MAVDPRTAAHGLPLRRLALVLDRPPVPAVRAWLRAHLGAASLEVPGRVYAVVPRSQPDGAGPGWIDHLDGLVEDLEGGSACDRRTIVGELGPAASGLDDGRTLLVLLGSGCGRGPGSEWAVRCARGPTLVLPPVPAPDGPGLEARLIVREPAEVPLLAPWTRVLGPDVTVTLCGLLSPTSESPARVLRDLAGLRAALEGLSSALRAVGREAAIEVGVDERAAERGASLVVRVARRGRLRRLFPGPDAADQRRRPRARLLIPPPSP